MPLFRRPVEMQAYKAFEQAMQILKTVAMPGTYRQHLLRELEYFKTQSLCESNWRDPDLTIKERWKKFLAEDEKLRLLDSVRLRSEVWTEMEYSVGIKLPMAPPLPKPPVDSGYSTWTAEDFLRHLELQALKKPTLKELEWRIMILGLIYLHAEARRPRAHRDEKYLKMVYQWIHPYLQVSGLMMPFKSEKNLVRRFKAFISNQIV